MDIPNAYVRSDLEEEIYMEIPEGYELPAYIKSSESMALLLQKGLYGLKQAGRNWNAKFKAFLISIGFVALTADNCVFVDHKRHIIIALYVDDTLIFAKETSTMLAIKKQLKDAFNAKDLGPASYILGIRIRRDENRLALDQTNYIKNILDEYNMADARPVNTPIDGYEALTPAKPNEPRTDQLEYQKRMGSIRYLVTCTRPDIAFVASKLSQYTHDPAVRHRVALDRVLRYLKGTMNLALTFDRTGSNFSTKPVGYANASYSDDVLDRKSTYGTTMILGNAACMWVNRKQQSTAGSTMEAEYISLCQAAKDIVWMTRWMNELQFRTTANSPPIQLCGDNKASMDLVKNPEHHDRSKHIDVQYHYTREVMADGLISIKQVPTNEMIADILTKPLTGEKFTKFRSQLGLKEWENAVAE